MDNNHEPMLIVGERLHIARSRAGVAVQDMARRLRKHRNRITAYEKADTLPLDLIRDYAEALGNVNPQWLAFEVGEPPAWPDSVTRRYYGIEQPTLTAIDGSKPLDDRTGDASPVPNTPRRAA